MRKLLLYTKSTHALIKGRRATRKQPCIYGLFKFAAITSTLWNEASLGHPYAIRYLSRVTYFIERLSKTLEDVDNRYEHQKSTLSQMETFFHEAPIPIPKKVKLNFANPYAYHAAYLLQRYDEILQTLNKLRDRGIIQNKQSAEEEKKLSRQIRAVFHSVADYRQGLMDDLKTSEKAMGPIEKISPLPCEPLYLPNLSDQSYKPPQTQKKRTESVVPSGDPQLPPLVIQ